MKILVTGCKGMLGRELVSVFSEDYTVRGIDVDEADITDREKIIATIETIAPDLIIHTAAYTDVDGCEKNVGIAYRVNGVGTQNVAIACRQIDATLVYISTDFVFDGTKREPYLESDQSNPLNVYGKSKLRGERYVQTLLNKYFIVRTSWLFGGNGRNFVETILRLAKEKDKLNIVDDQVGSPTYTKDLAYEIKRLIKANSYGIYHISNNGSCSWYEFAKEIFKVTNLNHIKVIPVKSAELNRPAPRPSYSVLKNYRLELTIGDEMRRWQGALNDYLQDGGLEND